MSLSDLEFPMPIFFLHNLSNIYNFILSKKKKKKPFFLQFEV